mmetsp:Transcript_41939/g.109215  ORF Transcript_41939/g.109215 Transcript_41939/m.109215 type:complete len:204 (+) Transcript_41939:605-1216(+)
MLGLVVAGGAPENGLSSLVGPERALEVHVRHPRVEPFLRLREADVLHRSLGHLPCPLQVAHLQMERHVADPDDGRPALCQQQSLEILHGAWLAGPPSLRVLRLPLRQLLGLGLLEGPLLPLRWPAIRLSALAVLASLRGVVVGAGARPQRELGPVEAGSLGCAVPRGSSGLPRSLLVGVCGRGGSRLLFLLPLSLLGLRSTRS